jgi:NADPH:quinone reductase-like Zn-dependent oxidoreductase
MKAVVYRKYGSPDVIRIEEIAQPVPKENEVLIRIHAAAVTPSDCAFRSGRPFAIRFFTGLFKPKQTPGFELSGVVEKTGSAIISLIPGDAVFAAAGTRLGAHAEYICLPETGIIATKPINLGFEESAAICDGGLTALVFLRDVAEIKAGQSILINGASGAVGAAAVQLAKYYGAEVTAVCSTANTHFVRSLGADHVIDYTQSDYTQSDFTRSGKIVDCVFDAVGKSSFSRCKKLLKRKGVYMSTVPGTGILLHMLWTSMTGGKQAKFAATGLQQQRDNLLFLRGLVEEGKLKPTMDKVFSFEEIADAHRYVETGRKRGNVVVTV